MEEYPQNRSFLFVENVLVVWEYISALLHRG